MLLILHIKDVKKLFYKVLVGTDLIITYAYKIFVDLKIVYDCQVRDRLQIKEQVFKKIKFLLYVLQEELYPLMLKKIC